MNLLHATCGVPSSTDGGACSVDGDPIHKSIQEPPSVTLIPFSSSSVAAATTPVAVDNPHPWIFAHTSSILLHVDVEERIGWKTHGWGGPRAWKQGTGGVPAATRGCRSGQRGCGVRQTLFLCVESPMAAAACIVDKFYLFCLIPVDMPERRLHRPGRLTRRPVWYSGE